MTDEKVQKWVASELRRGRKIGGTEGRKIRYRAKVLFDIRFPNPDICHSCGRKKEAA